MMKSPNLLIRLASSGGTGNPSLIISILSRNNLSQGSFPNIFEASEYPAISPGTPTDNPPNMDSRGIPSYIPLDDPAGAVSRKLNTLAVELGCLTIINPPLTSVLSWSVSFLPPNSS